MNRLSKRTRGVTNLHLITFFFFNISNLNIIMLIMLVEESVTLRDSFLSFLHSLLI